MRFALFAAAATLFGSALATPLVHARADNSTKACMNRDDATQIVEVYRRLIANYTDSDCEKYCADSFVDNSDSINSFLLQPLGEPTFATKKIFMDAQALNPPFPLVVDSIDAVDCEALGMRWHATFGDAMKPSKGITILKTTKEKGWWQITEINVEFNSLMWLLDMGGNYTWTG
ncbi:hypothetical protein SPI_02253 [Niveomyces insectorum RCEF 264]|uniref:NTF2-like domain-containing protein n=1 Tax=Niveomyces insectorum RCEF 264 TaxID=1081102 RepID=A0A167XVS1_9HYPO|nr:hypothetical protein SPI_02253 [Niveomyces insectorum RCEF 264]